MHFLHISVSATITLSKKILTLNQPLVLLVISANPMLALARRPTTTHSTTTTATTTKTTAPTATGTKTPLGNLTFGSPQCGSDFSHPLSGFNPSDCLTALNQMLADNCASGLCTIPPSNPPVTLSTGVIVTGGSFLFLDVLTCQIIMLFDNDNGATFNETPVLDAFTAFIDQCTTTPGNTSGLPIVSATNAEVSLNFEPSEGFE